MANLLLAIHIFFLWSCLAVVRWCVCWEQNILDGAPKVLGDAADAAYVFPFCYSSAILRYYSTVHPTSFEKEGDRGRSIESAYTNKNRHSVVSVFGCGGYEMRTRVLSPATNYIYIPPDLL